MSPSEDKGLALGLRLRRFERCRRTTMVDGKKIVTKVFAEFESPPIQLNKNSVLRGCSVSTRRHLLQSYAKSRAGAWRHAIRWLRELQAGKLR